MPHEKIRHYLQSIESLVRKLKNVYVERYEEEILTGNRSNIRLKIRFQSGALLEINEAVVVEGGSLEHLGFRYHFQDHHNQLIFRYDNTPHFPKLSNFPDHKHSLNAVAGCVRPKFNEVLDEAVSWERCKIPFTF
jgi:uncharacterized protein Usg